MTKVNKNYNITQENTWAFNITMAVHLNFHEESSNLPNNLHAMIPFQSQNVNIPWKGHHDKQNSKNKGTMQQSKGK